MPKKRDKDRDQRIGEKLLANVDSRTIAKEEDISLATISRRRQELKVLTLKNFNQYQKHQQQLVEVAQELEKSLDLREPAFMDIEDIYRRQRWDIEWELSSGTQLYRIKPKEIRDKIVEFFGREVKILFCFEAHVGKTSLPSNFEEWSKVGGEYVRECWQRLSQIKQEVNSNLPQEMRIISSLDTKYKAGINSMFYWTIYSYPLRHDWSDSKCEYKPIAEYDNGIREYAVYCDKDKASPHPIFQASYEVSQQLINLHQRLLSSYRLVGLLKGKWQETKQVANGIRSQLNRFIVDEFVPGTCIICQDWVKGFPKHIV